MKTFIRIGRFVKSIGVLTLVLMTGSCAAIQDQRGLSEFIDTLVDEQEFDRPALKKLFAGVAVQEQVLQLMASPAEAKPWHAYRKIFVTDSRISGGVDFWRANEATLARVESEYGVPPEVIVAIIGVETRYGGYTGSYRVIDALYTLAFHYPKRAKFFRKELEQFLLLCREEKLDPAKPKGSYAGAMGLPQFIPSSYRSYAADFDGDDQRDIWSSSSDSIASVANYFAKHGWRTGEQVTVPVKVDGDKYKDALGDGLELEHAIDELIKLDIKIPEDLKGSFKAKLLQLDREDGPAFWLGLHNFYVITRYNHSALYAMAVHQLSQKIRSRFGIQAGL